MMIALYLSLGALLGNSFFLAWRMTGWMRWWRQADFESCVFLQQREDAREDACRYRDMCRAAEIGGYPDKDSLDLPWEIGLGPPQTELEKLFSEGCPNGLGSLPTLIGVLDSSDEAQQDVIAKALADALKKNSEAARSVDRTHARGTEGRGLRCVK